VKVVGERYEVSIKGQPNKRLKLTANRAALKFSGSRRQLSRGVMSPLHVEATKSPAAPQLKAVEVAWIMREVG